MQTFRCRSVNPMSSMLLHHLSFEVDKEADPLLQGYQGCVCRDKLAVHHRFVIQYEDKQAPAQSNRLHLELLMSLWVHIKCGSALKTGLSCGPVTFQLVYGQKDKQSKLENYQGPGLPAVGQTLIQ